jgi:hypothetical protein
MDTSRPRPGRLTRPLGVLAAGLLLAAAAACGSGGSGGAEDSQDAASTPTGTPSETVEPTEDTTDPEETQMPGETPYLDPSMGSSDEPDSGAAMTITGTIEAGVESGCLVMTYDGTVYGIFGQYDRSVVFPGAEVTLRGHLDPGMMSFCQQGTPFVVEEAEAAG